MPYLEADSGVIHLDSEITFERSIDFLTTIRHMDQDSKASELVVHILCHGGSLLPSIAIAQALRARRKSVHTIGTGYVASGAVAVLAAGSKGKRKVIEGTKIVVHEPSSNMTQVSQRVPGVATWEREVALMKETFEAYYWILEKCSNRSAQFWRGILESKPDRLLTDAEAVEFGLIDEIIPFGSNELVNS